jgi:CHAT domain-containing protein
VASLWPVADESTAFLIADFFRRLAALDARSELVDYARALRDAKRALRTQPTWQDPYYWAPFVLSGSR